MTMSMPIMVISILKKHHSHDKDKNKKVNNNSNVNDKKGAFKTHDPLELTQNCYEEQKIRYPMMAATIRTKGRVPM